MNQDRDLEPSDEHVLAVLDALRDSAVVREARSYAQWEWARRAWHRAAWKRLRTLQGAGVLAGAVLAGLVFVLVLVGPFSANGVIKTRTGEIRSVELHDGSTVIMDTNSKIQVAFDRKMRLVKLLRGQAIFKVAHDTSRPFRVVTDDMVVTDVGTEFNVLALPGRTSVTLVQGRVVVDAKHAVGAGARRDTSLRPGEQLAINADGALSPKRKVALDTTLAWQWSRVDLTDLTVAQAIAEMNRYTKVKLVLEDRRIAARRISGTFKAGDIDALVTALELYFHLKVRSRTDTTIVLG